MSEEDIKAASFDEFTSTHQTQILKAAIPYIHVTQQKFLAIYIKFHELLNTIAYFRENDNGLEMCSNIDQSDHTMEMLGSIRKVCTKQEQETIDTIMNAINMFQMVNQFQTMAKEFNNANTAADDEAGNEPGNEPGNEGFQFDILKAILPPEQQEMFQMYREMFQNNVP